MELDEVSRRRAHRRANNLCLYCGDSKHFLRDCPHRRQVNAIEASKKVQEPAATTSVLYASKKENC